jgi:hypothetical protein
VLEEHADRVLRPFGERCSVVEAEDLEVELEPPSTVRRVVAGSSWYSSGTSSSLSRACMSRSEQKSARGRRSSRSE